MKHLLKGIMAIGIMPLVMSGCVTAPQQGNMAHPHGKRIFIPQERVIIERLIPPKVVLILTKPGLLQAIILDVCASMNSFWNAITSAILSPVLNSCVLPVTGKNVAAHNMPSQIVNYGITSWQLYVYLNTW